MLELRGERQQGAAQLPRSPLCTLAMAPTRRALLHSSVCVYLPLDKSAGAAGVVAASLVFDVEPRRGLV